MNYGGEQAVMASVYDVTVRKQAEDALRESEQRLQQALGVSRSFTFEWLPATDEVSRSVSCAVILGLSGDEIHHDTGQRYIQRVHPDDRAQFVEMLRGLTPAANAYATEYRVVRRDGSIAVLEEVGQAAFDAAGQLARLVGVTTDITARKHAEDALRESERRLARSQEIARLGSWELDLVANSLVWSDEVYRIFGLQPQEFGATYEAFLERVHPDDRATVDAAYSGSLQEQRDAYELEHRVVRKDNGEIRFVHEKCEHVRDAAGLIIRSVGMVHDVTERRRAEEALRQTMEELERSNKELEQFAYIASHDLQEPLRQVSGFGNLLSERYADQLDDKGKQYIAYMAEGSRRMSNLVRALLDYSRVGRPGHEVEPVAAGEILNGVLLDLKATVEECGARVTQQSLPTVLAHQVELGQLFQNLIGNALKFRREGVTPEIHVGCRPDGQTCTFWVKDNGIGIPPDLHEKAFQVFQRLHGQGKYPGTGIGLAICKKIVERHGGRIWIESTVGEGSTFFFALPLAKEVQA